jgi:hypothetical protein
VGFAAEKAEVEAFDLDLRSANLAAEAVDRQVESAIHGDVLAADVAEGIVSSVAIESRAAATRVTESAKFEGKIEDQRIEVNECVGLVIK